ncbi:MAG: exopolyphosphatase [Bacteroidetes bacterium]|nr:MAG: exopolyphosphatase [Bacteroidota bacterium]
MKAVIDLGTNTFHLFIADVKGDVLIEYFKLQIPVKLGKGGINNNLITGDSFERGLLALNEFKKYINQFGVDEVLAFATSAIRNAKNGPDFIDAVKVQCGITITSITGDQEAMYIYEGVRHSFTMPAMPVLVMDIGGGSVEFIIGNRQEILYKQSIEIGAARLLEKFHKHNPITEAEVAQINQYLEEVLVAFKEAVHIYKPIAVVGAAGSFETLADVVLKDLAVIPLTLSKHAREIRFEDFEIFVEVMKTSTLEQRSKLKGMVDFRTEMITVATVLMDVVMKVCGVKRIIVSDYSLKEGVFFS